MKMVKVFIQNIIIATILYQQVAWAQGDLLRARAWGERAAPDAANFDSTIRQQWGVGIVELKELVSYFPDNILVHITSEKDLSYLETDEGFNKGDTFPLSFISLKRSKSLGRDKFYQEAINYFSILCDIAWFCKINSSSLFMGTEGTKIGLVLIEPKEELFPRVFPKIDLRPEHQVLLGALKTGIEKDVLLSHDIARKITRFLVNEAIKRKIEAHASQLKPQLKPEALAAATAALASI